MNDFQRNEIDIKKQRWIRFLNLDPDIHTMIIAGTSYGLEKKPRVWPWLEKERVEWHWAHYLHQLDNLSWLNDDTIPALQVNTGTEIFAAAFGCVVHYPDDNMPFAKPLISSSDGVDNIIVPKLKDSSLMQLFDMADALYERADGEALMRLPDIQSPMDIACLIWDKNDIYMAMILEPEAVKKLAHMVNGLLTEFLDEWFKRYGIDFIAHHPYYYMPYGITLSEDEIGVINNQIFTDLFLPELENLSLRYGQIGIHCCADAMHQWPLFKDISNLKLVNFNQPKERIKKAYPMFIGHSVQMHSWQGDGDMQCRREQLPNDAHIVFNISGEGKDEIIEQVNALR